MTDISIIVLSCDKYEDCWYPFFKLLNKYFKNHPKTYLVTESKQCEYSDTINVNSNIWTKRFREALEQIDTKYVLVMLDDFFLQNNVDIERIQYVIDNFKDDTAVFNFEMAYDARDIETSLKSFKKRQKIASYKNSCQPSIHDRLKLIERLQEDKDPWQWELTSVKDNYNYYINSGDVVFDIGYYVPERSPWGIVGGKWSRNTERLFKKEGIEVDFNERGFID